MYLNLQEQVQMEQRVGHGLGARPEMVYKKIRSI